jgi:NAD(P)-dependent dehydrogenase (short-subunit alcohol dehydrogenase family)
VSAPELDLSGLRLLVKPSEGALGGAVSRLGASRGAELTRTAPADLLVCLPSAAASVSPLEISDVQWAAALDAGAMRVFRACREAAPAMAEGGRGAIVVVVEPDRLGTDEALLGLTRSLARELAVHGVRVNAVRAEHPDPVRVAELALFLLSDAASYVTGTTLRPPS